MEWLCVVYDDEAQRLALAPVPLIKTNSAIGWLVQLPLAMWLRRGASAECYALTDRSPPNFPGRQKKKVAQSDWSHEEALVKA